MSQANSNSSRALSGSVREEGAVNLARIDRLRNSIPGKDSLLDELIDLFVSDLPGRLSAITQAVERADAPTVALQAHALRGGAANFGAARLDELCARLEEIGVRGSSAESPAILDELRCESARVRDALLGLRSEHPTKPTDVSPDLRPV